MAVQQTDPAAVQPLRQRHVPAGPAPLDSFGYPSSDYLNAFIFRDTMATVKIEMPSELLSALGKRPADAVREIQLMAALKLFECGRISGGMAAELAGLSRAEFLAVCGQHGVSVFQQTAEELADDVKAISDARHR